MVSSELSTLWQIVRTISGLTNTHDAQGSLGYSDRCLHCNDHPIKFCCLWCAAMTKIKLLTCSFRSIVPTMIYVVFLYDDYHLLFPVVWFLAAYHDYRHGRKIIYTSDLNNGILTNVVVSCPILIAEGWRRPRMRQILTQSISYSLFQWFLHPVPDVIRPWLSLSNSWSLPSESTL